MAIEIKAPQFPESIVDGTVATWHKKPGRPKLILETNPAMPISHCRRRCRP